MSDEIENRLLLITGPAGAGRSTAVKALEDIGFESIDNLPVSLLPRLLGGGPLKRPLVIGIDTRTRGFDVAALIEFLDATHQSKPQLLFVECEEETLLRRFNETRRRHPLAPEGSLLGGILQEKTLLQPLFARADFLIDTTYLTPHDLKAELGAIFTSTLSSGLSVAVRSFSYKKGIPRGLDMVIDCRFLQNPHWQPELRRFDGTDAAVADFVKSDPLFEPFFERLTNLCDFLLPAYKKEGKAYFSIGLGCSGGKHRSVCVAENLARHLDSAGWHVSLRHIEPGHDGIVPTKELE